MFSSTAVVATVTGGPPSKMVYEEATLPAGRMRTAMTSSTRSVGRERLGIPARR
jgi:hypothetical protein